MDARAVVVGTGFGCRVHVPALRMAGFDVAALVGTDPDRTRRRAEKAGVPRVFTDLDTAVGETGATVVTVATPPATHARLVLAALRRGCHVICEKPMALDADEGRAMLVAAEDAGVVHLMGNEFRWQADRALIGRTIADGSIGEPRLLTLVTSHSLVADPDARMPRWWFDEAAGGGWLGAAGSHAIDQVRAWLGDIASVSAALPAVSGRVDAADDSYSMRLRTAGGVEGVIQQTAAAWGPPIALWRVAGTKGAVWSENGVVRLADRDGVRDVPVPAELALPELPVDADPARRFSHLELGPYARLCEALRAAIAGEPVAAPIALPTFADGLAAMIVTDAVRRSASEGGRLVQL